MGRSRKSRSRRFVRCSAVVPNSTPRAASVNRSEGDNGGIGMFGAVAAPVRTSCRITRKTADARPKVLASKNVMASAIGPRTARSSMSAGLVHSPVQRRTGLPLQAVSFLRADNEPAVEVDVNSPDPNRSTTCCSRAMPSCSVRYMLMPSANSNVGRSAGIASSQDGSVAGVATRW